MYIMLAYDHRNDHQTVHAGIPAGLVDHLLDEYDPDTWRREDHDKAFLRLKEAATATLPDRPDHGTFKLILSSHTGDWHEFGIYHITL